ncbi:hypothetical protein Celaphus_00009309, partial [Cervus elaphus hippelaphus]
MIYLQKTETLKNEESPAPDAAGEREAKKKKEMAEEVGWRRAAGGLPTKEKRRRVCERNDIKLGERNGKQ